MGYTNGIGTNALMGGPTDVCFFTSDTLYFLERYTQDLRSISDIGKRRKLL
jgi:hypothetical protein